MSVRMPVAFLAAVALAAAACSGSETSSDRGQLTIVLLTHDSFDVSRNVVRSFERESGIDLQIVPAGDAGQLVNRAILTAGNPEGDVLFGVDDSLFPKAVEEGVFATYESPELSRVDDAYELDPTHAVTPVDRGDVCLNVDLDWFDERGLDPPTDLADLTDGRYRGLAVVENPATSTPGLAFLLATIARFGDDGWQAYWRDLRANDALVVDGWEQAYFGEFSGAGGGEGERPIVVSYATSPVAEVVLAEEPLDRAPTAAVTESCYRQVEFAGVLAGTEHPRGGAGGARLPAVEVLPGGRAPADVRLPGGERRRASRGVRPVGRGTRVAARPAARTGLAEREAWVQTWTDLMLG